MSDLARRRPDDEVEVGNATVWTVMTGGLALWMVHLAGVAVLAPIACDRGPAWLWGIHGLTIVTAAGAIACIALSWRLWRVGRARHGADRSRLLGGVGVFLNTIGLLLILAEEAPALFLDACAR